MTRPSNTDRFRCLRHRFASSTLAIVTNPKPRDSLVHGSTTRLMSTTFPSLAKCFSSSFFVTRADKPVTYKPLPGFSTSLESRLLERLDLDKDLDMDLLSRYGEREREEYLDRLE
eukprot:TRINITY_DN1830_c0_g1_i4.p2 TRINITY_DN1830_c0_g1~~TRINITY_DN1830_c0_g1_i4.p2  ORF type:complete len:115 (-),score=2.69 TRINITY_DN1830_c0_g1_i4:85-429(-)